MRHARSRRAPFVVQFCASFHVATSAFGRTVAMSELAPEPVSLYAAVFFLVNAAYICLIWELMD
jgi:hypothetical protein